MEEFYTFIIDNNQILCYEGQEEESGEKVIIPMVGTTKEEAERLIPSANYISKHTGKKWRLMKCQYVEEISKYTDDADEPQQEDSGAQGPQGLQT